MGPHGKPERAKEKSLALVCLLSKQGIVLTQTTVIEKLKNALPYFPITKAWLFGPYSTGEATEDSDIDLLVDYDKTDDFSLFTISSVISGLSRIMNRHVDVVEDGHLLTFAQEHADNTKILIYERGA